MENINLYYLIGILLVLILYIGLFKTKIGKAFLYDVFDYGCYVLDEIRHDDTDLDIIKTEYIGPLKIFGESIVSINTWGTHIKSITTKNSVITLWINGEATIQSKSEYKRHNLDKEVHLKEMERFEKKFFKKVKVDKSEFYKTRMKYGIDSRERSK